MKIQCRNILSIGCESFYMIRLGEDFNYVEHFVNMEYFGLDNYPVT